MYHFATVQFKAEYGQPEKNREILTQLCTDAVNKNASVIILPEMCLTGYIWQDRNKLYDLAEKSDGETFRIFSRFCRINNCFICYGYAEKENDILYNSQILIGPNGSILANYRKIHLFIADTLWANPGDRGFKSIDTALGRIGLGICMDLNFDDFLEFHIKMKTDIILFAANWLEEYIDVLSYWKKRFQLYNGTVYISNTYGFEDDIEFCGMSSVLKSGEFVATAPRVGNKILTTTHNL